MIIHRWRNYKYTESHLILTDSLTLRSRSASLFLQAGWLSLQQSESLVDPRLLSSGCCRHSLGSNPLKPQSGGLPLLDSTPPVLQSTSASLLGIQPGESPPLRYAFYVKTNAKLLPNWALVNPWCFLHLSNWI